MHLASGFAYRYAASASQGAGRWSSTKAKRLDENHHRSAYPLIVNLQLTSKFQFQTYIKKGSECNSELFTHYSILMPIVAVI